MTKLTATQSRLDLYDNGDNGNNAILVIESVKTTST